MAEHVRQLRAEAAEFREEHCLWPKVLAGLRVGTMTPREAAKRLGIRNQALQEALAALDADSPKVTSDRASA